MLKTATAAQVQPMRTSTERRRSKQPESTPADMVQHLQAEITRLRGELQQQQTVIAELEELAHIDPLTSVANRRAFEAHLDLVWNTYQRYGRPGALIMLDLNKFKQINDTFGHQAGDRVLAHVAAILQENSRKSDLIARLGGDEFALILPDIKPGALKLKLARIAEAIHSTPCRLAGQNVYLSASIGGTLFTDVTSQQALIAHADATMYAQKHR